MQEPNSLEAAAPVDPSFYWVAAVVFVVTFAVIVSEKLHKTKVALLGAVAMIVLPILTQEEAFHSPRLGIDYNVVFLLISMMVIVNIIGRTGLFEYMAVRSAKLAGGRPMAIMIIFAALTAVASAFLDNVTTVLLMAPVTLLIADELDIDPVPYLIAEALSSNIGGTATLIGDPPNIIIGSRANLSFVDFLEHLAPAVIVMMAGFVVALRLFFGRRLRVDEQRRRRIMQMDPSKLVREPALAKKSLIVLGLTLVGFVLHGALHLEPATVALAGAAVLLAISRLNPHDVLSELEWPTIFFFMGLFIVVGGIVKVGVIADLATLLIDTTHPSPDDMHTTAMTVLWGSAFLSAVVDNIPYVATMTPLILDMASTVYHDGEIAGHALPAATIHGPTLMPVWWALALGSCLGGNGTAIGASANVVVIGIAERNKIHISFLRFCAYGFPTMLFTLVVSHIYIQLRYY